MWSQQTVVMRDGDQATGRIVSASDRQISFQDRDGRVRQIDMDRIQEIRFDRPDNFDRGGAYPQGNNGAYPQGNNGGYPRGGDDRGYSARPPQDIGEMSIPAGTGISVRTNETIDTQDAAQSRTFSAEVSRDVLNAAGNVAIPRGSDARLVVRRIGDGNLALDLESVSVNGRRFLVNTNDVAAGQEGVGANRRTGEYAGGGAVLGTLLGAIAGGGKGAAIGALAGGAAGVGAEVLTRGNRVRVPAESVLNFRLDAPMRLRPER
jgi:hypothetical protein